MLIASSVAVLRAVGAIDLFRQPQFGSASCRGFWVLDVFRCPSGSRLWIVASDYFGSDRSASGRLQQTSLSPLCLL